MFETAELGRKLDKEEYKREESELRTTLLKVQHELDSADFPVIILVNGMAGARKGDVVNLINEWMDTRNIMTEAFEEPTEEESQRPAAWRYWMALPPAGRIGVLTHNWYTDAIRKRVYKKINEPALGACLTRANSLEKTLVDNGALIIKIWLHISRKQQAKRFKRLSKNPDTRWRVTRQDRKDAKSYDVFRKVCERTIRETSTGEAPWFVVESADRRYRRITVAKHIAAAIRKRMEAPRSDKAPRPLAEIDDPETILDTLDLSLTIDPEVYAKELEQAQGRLNTLARKAREKKVGVTLVFEGTDAAGKGGAIRRIIAPLDARQYRVIRVAAPTDEEKVHHYLWRFWRHLPRLGRFTIYDRSWYGRLLVERVEGFATEPEWMRSYKEINDFEEQLVEHGIVLMKFWVHISKDEQARRFEAREQTPWKQYKITDEDYRNREKANLYEAAANEMIERTSTEYAPWTLIESEDKRYARVKVVKALCDRLSKAIDKAK